MILQLRNSVYTKIIQLQQSEITGQSNVVRLAIYKS